MPSDTAAPVPAEPAPDQQVLAYINGLREDALLRSRHLARRSDTGSEGLYHPCRMSAPDPKPLTRPPALAMVEGRRASAPNRGWRGLAAFWASVAMAFGSGALVLQHLGPPPDGLPARRDAAIPPRPHAPEPGSGARPATATAKHQDVVGPAPSDPVLDAWSAERSQVRSAAEVAQTGRVIRDTNGTGDAGPPAGRDHSEPAAPAPPDDGPETALATAAHSSAHLGSDASVALPPTAPSPPTAPEATPQAAAPPAASPSPAPGAAAPVLTPAPAPSSVASLPEPPPVGPPAVATAALPVPPPEPPPPDAPTSGPAAASTAGASAMAAPAQRPASTASDRLPRVTVREPANLRTGPDGRANVIRVVPRGETLRVHNRTANGWLQVGDAEPRGWLHTSRLGGIE